MAELSIVEAINDAFHVELERDESVLVMGEDVGRAGGVFRATAGLRDRFGPDRCVDTTRRLRIRVRIECRLLDRRADAARPPPRADALVRVRLEGHIVWAVGNTTRVRRGAATREARARKIE